MRTNLTEKNGMYDTSWVRLGWNRQKSESYGNIGGCARKRSQIGRSRGDKGGN